CFFFSSRRRHTRSKRDWSSDVCSSDLKRLSTSMLPSPSYDKSTSTHFVRRVFLYLVRRASSLYVDVQTFSLLYILRKEVIQPHLPIRLPCYDFTPIICPSFGGSLLKGCLTDFGCCELSWCDGRCVQGPGTDSPWHADPRLLAIP